MARRPNEQQRIDFAGIDADARAAFIERNNELRSKLRSIEVSLTGLSRRRWEQTIEVLMSVWVHATTTKTAKATTRLVATSGLSLDQYRRGRRAALALGLVAAVRSYAGTKRETDRLDVDIGAVDRMVAESQLLKRQKLRPTATQLRPSAPHIKEEYPRARCLELPNTSSTSSSASEEKQSEEEVFILYLAKEFRRLKVALPQRFGPAVSTAFRNGLTRQEIGDRCKWFFRNQTRWPFKHRPGALHDGIAKATPDMPASEGWPYQAGQVEAR